MMPVGKLLKLRVVYDGLRTFGWFKGWRHSWRLLIVSLKLAKFIPEKVWMIQNLLLLVNLTQTCWATETTSKWKQKKSFPLVSATLYNICWSFRKAQEQNETPKHIIHSVLPRVLHVLSPYNLQSQVHTGPLSLKSTLEEQEWGRALSHPHKSCFLYTWRFSCYL